MTSVRKAYLDQPEGVIPPHFHVLQDIPWLDARIFTAEGGVSTGLYAAPTGKPGLNCAVGGDDSEAAKRKNREIVAGVFGVNAEQLLTTREETYTVRVVREAWTLANRPTDNALVISAFYDHPIGVLTANCSPVILADKTKPLAAIAHIGTYQSVKGLMEQTVEKMEQLGSRREDIAAVIGPCAGVRELRYIINSHSDTFYHDAIQQDPDIARFFIKSGRDLGGRPEIAFLLQPYLEHRLSKFGIIDAQSIKEDTMLCPQYYSQNDTPSRLMFAGVMVKKL